MKSTANIKHLNSTQRMKKLRVFYLFRRLPQLRLHSGKSPKQKWEMWTGRKIEFWWTNGYHKWTNEQFKHRLRVERSTCELILEKIGLFIEKDPTNMILEPIEEHRQLALTIYRLGHGTTFNTLSDLFGVSMSLAERCFNIVIRLLVSNMYMIRT